MNTYTITTINKTNGYFTIVTKTNNRQIALKKYASWCETMQDMANYNNNIYEVKLLIGKKIWKKSKITLDK